MRNYELTVILDGNVTPAKRKAFLERMEKLVKVFKGKSEKVDDWGKIELAYKIKKVNTGNFLLFNLKLEAEMVKQLDVKLRLDEEILRYLLIKAQK